MAVPAIGNRIKETTTSTGTGDLLLAGAASGYKAFSTAKRVTDGTPIQDGDYVSYVVSSTSGDMEEGIGIWNSVANSITRIEVKGSSNADALVAFAAGSKDVFLTVLASALLSSNAPSQPPSPKSVSGLMAWYSTRLSQIDRVSGYVTKWYDISGNGRHSDVATGLARPFFLSRGFNRGFPGIRFNGVNQRLTFSAIPGLGSPLNCTIGVVVQNYSNAFGSGNKHLLNWAGNPILFLGSGPEYVMYNGSLLTSTATYTQVTSELPKDIDTHPFLMLAAFNGSGNTGILSINDTEYPGTVGTVATGATGSFTIGSDSAATPANFAGFIVTDVFVHSKSMSTAERQQMREFARSTVGAGW